MWFKSKVADLVQIAPHDFSKNSMDAIEDNINTKYANKVNIVIHPNVLRLFSHRYIQVIQKIGLCICLWDVLWSSEGLIGHGTGLVNVNGEQPLLPLGVLIGTDSQQVEFRLVVFRPFKGEVLLGRITSGTQDGINSKLHILFHLFQGFLHLISTNHP